MYFSYDKLWKLLSERNMTRKDLRTSIDVSTNLIARLGKNRCVNTDSLLKICAFFNCDITEIMEFVPDYHAANIKPVSDLKNYNEVLCDIAVDDPLFLTRNGKVRYVIVDIEDYNKQHSAAENNILLTENIDDSEMEMGT